MTSTEDLINQYTHYNRFIKELKSFHRLNDDYFKDDTELKYDGDVLTIVYTGITGNARIVRKRSFAEQRYNSKLCYIPAERNLISAIQNVDKTYKATERDILLISSMSGMKPRSLILKSIPSDWLPRVDSAM